MEGISCKLYDSHFRKWASWYRDSICGPTSDVANFLAELYEGQIVPLFPQPMNMLMVTLWVSTPPLLKGAFNPSQNTPLHGMGLLSQGTLPENHSLSLKLLSLELVVQPVLSRPSRYHDLSNLDLRYMKFLLDGMELAP